MRQPASRSESAWYESWRTAATWASPSASGKLTPWNWPIGLPKAVRSLA
jgi:hypothetical protein